MTTFRSSCERMLVSACGDMNSVKEYEQARARISKLDTIVQRLYEDNTEDKISDERFSK